MTPQMDSTPVYYGREISWDIYGSCMIFATRRDAEDFPCITIDLCDEIEAFAVFKMCDDSDDVVPARHGDVAENEPQHSGRNAKLTFSKLPAQGQIGLENDMTEFQTTMVINIGEFEGEPLVTFDMRQGFAFFGHFMLGNLHVGPQTLIGLTSQAYLDKVEQEALDKWDESAGDRAIYARELACPE